MQIDIAIGIVFSSVSTSVHLPVCDMVHCG